MLISVNNYYNKFIDIINFLLKWFIIILLACLVMVVLMQVFFRYVLFASLPWSEELSRFLQIWLVMIAAAYGMSFGEHIVVDFFIDKFEENKNLYKILTFTAYLICFILLIYFTRHSYILADRSSIQTSTALNISMFWPHLALPAGGFLMILQVIKILLNLITPDLIHDKRNATNKTGRN